MGAQKEGDIKQEYKLFLLMLQSFMQLTDISTTKHKPSIFTDYRKQRTNGNEALAEATLPKLLSLFMIPEAYVNNMEATDALIEKGKAAHY